MGSGSQEEAGLMGSLDDLAKLLGVSAGYLGSLVGRLGIAVTLEGRINLAQAVRALAARGSVMPGKARTAQLELPIAAPVVPEVQPKPTPEPEEEPPESRVVRAVRVSRVSAREEIIRLFQTHEINAEICTSRSGPWTAKIGKALAVINAASLHRKDRVVRMGMPAGLVPEIDFSLVYFERDGKNVRRRKGVMVYTKSELAEMTRYDETIGARSMAYYRAPFRAPYLFENRVALFIAQK